METKVVQLIADINDTAPAQQQSLQDIIRASLIPQGIEVPKPEIVFGINGIPIFTKRSISVLIGRAKSGKTTVTAWLASDVIKRDVNLLWIDTEQGLYYGSRTQHWILSMSGLPSSAHLQFYDLKIYSPTKRLEIVEEVIKIFTPDLVVIDGIRDLVFDINSPEEATTRVGDISRWAEQYNCHILNIIHQNKGNDHARGHLGTEIINKAETVIKVEVNEDKLIICSPEYTRSQPFDIFAFDRDDRGMPVIVEGFAGKITTSGGERVGRPKTNLDPTDIAWNNAHVEIIDQVFSKEKFLKYEQILDFIRHYFKKHGKDMNRNNANEFAVHYTQTGIIWKNPYVTGWAKYEKNPKWEGFPYVAPTISTKEKESPF